MLEETKKEVREIRSIEAQMKWNMAREEQKNKAEEEKDTEEEIRDWRWRQSDEMREFVDEQAKVAKVVGLEESKDFQEFKREIKTQVKIEEQQYISEAYEQDVENAAWRAEFAQVVVEQDKEVILDRSEDIQHIKEARIQQKLREKAEAGDARAVEESNEMANLARQLAKEKEQLLESLELTRVAQRVPVGNGRGTSRASFGR